MMIYEYDPINSIIHLRASGVLVASDPINYFRKIDENTSFRPKAEERIYFTGLEDIAFTYNEILLIKNAFEKHKHGEKISHGIFVVDTDFSFGMARMVMTLFDDVFEKFTVERI